MASTAFSGDFVSGPARRTYWAFTVATFCVFLSGSSTALFAPVFLGAGLHAAQAGLLLSSGALPAVACTLVVGTWAPRVGPIPVLRVGVALILFGFLLLQLTVPHSSLPGMTVAVMTLGAGLGAFMPAAFLLVRRLLGPKRLVRYIGVYSAMLQLPAFVGPLAAQYVLEHAGSEMFFAIMGMPCGMALLWLLGVRGPTADIEVNTGVKQDRGYVATLWAGLPWAPNLLGMIGGAIFGAVNAFIAVSLMERGIAVAWFFTAFAAGYLAMRGLLAFLDGVSTPVMVGGGIGAMTIGIAVAMSPHGDAWFVGAGGMLFGFGYSTIYPLCSLWVSESCAPGYRSRLVAIFNAIFTFAVNVAPLAASLVLQMAGMVAFQWMLVACGTVTVLALVVGRLRLAGP